MTSKSVADDASAPNALAKRNWWVKVVLVAVLCALGASLSTIGTKPPPIRRLEEEISKSNDFQSRHLAHEHQRLRRKLTQRKLRYTPKRHRDDERELKLLQEESVDCSQYQFTLAITDKLRINYVVVADESSAGGGYFKAEMVYQGRAWLGFAHSRLGNMVGSLAVIGVPVDPPNDHQVQKYKLSGTDLGSIEPMLPANQTLLDTSLVQTDDTTIMRFTKLLSEPSELSIQPSWQNTFLFAHGSSNDLGFHETRGVLVLDLVPCLQSKRSHNTKPGDRIEQDPEDRYEATSSYVISVGGSDSTVRQDPPPSKPIEYKQIVPEKQPPIDEDSSTSATPEEPLQFDIPDQFTVDDDHLKNLPLSYTHPTKGIKIWWTLHGFFAMLTCGILLPVVIACYVLQGCWGNGKKRPRYHNNEIYRWSNFLLILAVMGTFITAVIGAAKDTTRNDTPPEQAGTDVDTITQQPMGPKPESYHSPAGLALFIVCLFFALTGNLRSYLTTAGGASPSQANEEEEQEEEQISKSDFNSETIKSMDPGLANIARRWDQFHCFVGVVLLFVCWWECQSGLEVFEYRFSDSWFTRTFFWAISGTCAGVLGFACTMQLLYLLLQWCYKAAYW